MPQTREQRAAYGPGWRAFSDGIRFGRADGRCECHGECGSPRHPGPDRCPAVQGEPSPLTGSAVVLTTAHLERDEDLATRDPDRVRAMCQCCHLAYDREQHTANAARTRAVARAGELDAAGVPGLFALEARR